MASPDLSPSRAAPLSVPFNERFFASDDGLKLFLRDYGSAQDPGLPVICLPGLSRNSADFGPLASALTEGLAGGRRRRVLALDYRGRGRSEYDSDYKNYSFALEHNDIFTALSVSGVERAIFMGTSRGGLHAMMLAAAHPSLAAGIVLNDIGPVLDRAGLARIRGYIGKVPPPQSLLEAVAALKRTMSAQFTLSDEEWEAYAKITFTDENGRFCARYDPQLAKAIDDLDPDNPPPPLWEAFDALRQTPLMIVRGETSDLLSEETLAEMVRRRPDAQTYIAPGQGHPALLLDQDSIGRIAAFVASVEQLG
ncbi:alpha/beta fold hydrolase [Methylocella silvestris]|uniref:Alpha/beta hydrolase n=1 Tax=Methylocella silvestris TaxID=199596 RepID=A0A2J7TFR5_METSI|nr:alpha/beta hydrolase [Methylocella silvestris]PNG25606.1 alpha/beta hydrolase [Methylocella silvestris]